MVQKAVYGGLREYLDYYVAREITACEIKQPQAG
jgi:hypothetical protein